MDVHSKEVRSYNMSQIKSKNTKPEIKIRKFLFSHGFRYRKNDKRYPGHPDIVLPKYHTVIFVNGCFWHMHDDCRDFSLPKTNTYFWKEKLENNKRRDSLVYEELKNMGWKVIVIWQCEIKNKLFESRMNQLMKQIKESCNISV